MAKVPTYSRTFPKRRRFSDPESSNVEKNKNPDSCIVRVDNLDHMTTPKLLAVLFGKIGPLVRVRKILSEAEIIFENRKDAERTVKMYHNKKVGRYGGPLKLKIVPKCNLGVRNPKWDTAIPVIRLQAQLRDQDIEIEDLKKEMAEMKKRAEQERRILLDRNERLERRLQKIKDLLRTEPFFQS